MPCHTTAPTRSTAKETTRKKTDNKISKNKHFTPKTEYQNLKAPSNNIKMQSDKILTAQIYFCILYNRWKFFLMRLGNKSTKRTNNEAKFKI